MPGHFSGGGNSSHDRNSPPPATETVPMTETVPTAETVPAKHPPRRQASHAPESRTGVADAPNLAIPAPATSLPCRHKWCRCGRCFAGKRQVFLGAERYEKRPADDRCYCSRPERQGTTCRKGTIFGNFRKIPENCFILHIFSKICISTYYKDHVTIKSAPRDFNQKKAP